MFVIKPNGNIASGNGESKVKSISKFFGKLGVYFVVIRAAHIYFGAAASDEADRSKSLL